MSPTIQKILEKRFIEARKQTIQVIESARTTEDLDTNEFIDYLFEDNPGLKHPLHDELTQDDLIDILTIEALMSRKPNAIEQLVEEFITKL